VWRGFDEGVNSGMIGDTKDAPFSDVEPDGDSDPFGNIRIDLELEMALRRWCNVERK